MEPGVKRGLSSTSLLKFSMGRTVTHAKLQKILIRFATTAAIVSIGSTPFTTSAVTVNYKRTTAALIIFAAGLTSSKPLQPKSRCVFIVVILCHMFGICGQRFQTATQPRHTSHNIFTTVLTRSDMNQSSPNSSSVSCVARRLLCSCEEVLTNATRVKR